MTHGETLLPEEESDGLEKVMSSIVERYRRGEDPGFQEYSARFPHLRERLQTVAAAFDMLRRCDDARARDASMEGSEGVPGKLGDYRILREVGRGGMGVVYEAEQVALGRRVALKVLPFYSLLDSRHLERFRREARAAARLHHTNIVPVYGVGEHEGVHYFAMQFIDGKGLDVVIREAARADAAPPRSLAVPLAHAVTDALARESSTDELDRTVRLNRPSGSDGIRGPYRTPAPSSFDVKRDGSGTDRNSRWAHAHAVAQIGFQVADALAHAHGEGILHRDIKPSNLILDERGNVWVTDFGLAKDTNSEALTYTGDVLGTLGYMAPERFEGHSDARSDVYSLGITLYELLTLRPTFQSSDRQSLIGEITQGELLPPRNVDPTIPRDLETIVLKATSRMPAHRYRSAQEMAQDLRRFLDNRPIQARRITWIERGWRWCRRRPAMTGLVVALVAAVAVVSLLSWRYREAQDALLKVESEARTGRLMSTAQRLHAEGRYEDALTFVNDVLDHTQMETGARLLRARLLIEIEDIDSALSDLEALVQDEPSNGEAHYLLSRIHRGRDDEKAREHEEAAERFLANTANAYHLRSLAASTWEESIRFLNDGLKLDPGHFSCLRSRAYALYAVKDYAGAERDAYVCTVLRPPDAPSWALRALSLRSLGRLDDALSDHDQVVGLSPQDPESYNQRRETYRLLGQSQRALDDAEICLCIEPGSLLYRLNYLAALLDVGKFPELHEEYDTLVQTRPDDRGTILRWLQKQIANRVATGNLLDDLPDASEGEPFNTLHQARSLALSWRAKATRVVALGSRIAWSPDGRRVAYARGNRSSRLLYGTGASGSDHLDDRIGGIEILVLGSGQSRLITRTGKDPAWSPNGQHIAFVREPSLNDYRREELWLVPADGGAERRIAFGGYPSWSQDSKRVVFQSRADATLYSIDIEAPEATPIKIVSCPSYYPALSPDERLLAYDSNGTLHVVDVETQRVVLSWAAPLSQGGLLVSWSPDGRELSIGGYDESSLGLWILDLNSLAARKVIDGPVTMGVWSPDRKRLAFDVRGAYYETWIADLDGTSSTAGSLGYSAEVLALPPPPDDNAPRSPQERSERAELVRALEHESRDQPENALVRERLAEYRRAVLPDLPTYASVDAALEEAEWRTLTPENETWRFFRGRSAPPGDGLAWTKIDYDDREWEEGQSGFGYGDGDDATVLDDMRESYTSVYIRRLFEIAEEEDIPQLWLVVRADDGFVAFVNGIEVGRAQAGYPGERIPHDGTATENADEPVVPVWVEIDEKLLRRGRNSVAIHGLNQSLTSSDFSLVPSLLERGFRSDLESELARFEAFRREAAGSTADARVAYLDGRLHARHGGHQEARALFLRAQEIDPDVAPLAALVRSARASGDALEAESRLRTFLETTPVHLEDCRTLANLWVAVCLVDLKKPLREVTESVPELPAETPESSLAFLSEMRWLLEALSAGKPVRINCGGNEYVSGDGVYWSPDRFYGAGHRYYRSDAADAAGAFPGAIAKTTDHPLYQTERWFERAAFRFPGYHVPLPPGSYRIQVHCAEIFHDELGSRVFSVRAEGEERLRHVEPLAFGFATAHVESFDVEVTDGILDLEWIHELGNPNVAALEIERIE